MRQDVAHRPFPPGALEKRPRRPRLQARYRQSQQVTPRAPGASLQRGVAYGSGRGLREWAGPRTRRVWASGFRKCD